MTVTSSYGTKYIFDGVLETPWSMRLPVRTVWIVLFGEQYPRLGAVVHRYADGEAFEVEFVTGERETVAVVTVAADDLRHFGKREILHARELVEA